MAILTIGSVLIVAMNRPKPHPTPFPTHAPAAMQPPATQRPAGLPKSTPLAASAISTQTPPTVPGAVSSPAASTSTTQYTVGSEVEANWAGGWISGKVTRVNPGGHSVMVQLDDARFPHPIVFSGRQLRPK